MPLRAGGVTVSAVLPPGSTAREERRMPPPPRLAALPVLLVLLAGCVGGTTPPAAAPAPATVAPTGGSPPPPTRPATATRSALVGTPATAALTAGCPVTPYADGPPTGSAGDRAIGGLRPYRWYGGDGLWAFPWLDGESPGTLYLDADGFHKVLWWREPEVQGAIAVTARRLDGPTTPIDVYTEGAPTQQGQQPGGLRFPTPGCWELTGTAGGKRLTIVALVAPRPATPTAPTPTRAAQPGPPAPSRGDCPATHPNGSTPPGEQPASIHHGNGALWVGLWPEGRVVIPADPAKPDGALAMKFPWWRGPGVRGTLTIAGRRLDAPAPPLAADIPEGYGDTGFQATALLFPTVGCWEVTGQAGDASLTFVALVLKAPAATPVVYPTPPLSADCDETAIRGAVGDFIAAFNAGDQAGLERVFPARGSDGDHPWAGDPDQLRWFTLSRADPDAGVDALNLYTRDTLLAYFAARHAQHERMRVVELVINAAASGPLTAAINFRITRTADDLPETTFGGKCGVGCAHGLIFLWSQGGPSGSLATPTP